MVSETLIDNASRPGSGVVAGGLEFEITDSTSSEQVAREQMLLSDNATETESVESQAPRQPGPDDGGEQRHPVDPGNESPAQVSKRRTYSQEEVSKMQAAWSHQIEDARKTAVQAGDQLRQFNLDAAVEAMLRKQESELATSIGTEQALKLTRSPQNTSLVRQSLLSQQRLAEAESARNAAEAQQEAQAKFVVANALIREHGLTQDDFEILSMAHTPAAMQKLARRLVGKHDAAMRERVPPETPETELENGFRAGPAPESADRRLERIRSRPSWEWTEADLRFMKTGEVK